VAVNTFYSVIEMHAAESRIQLFYLLRPNLKIVFSFLFHTDLELSIAYNDYWYVNNVDFYRCYAIRNKQNKNF
jgi:hypothetical protein